jgi:hypothetical protein
MERLIESINSDTRMIVKDIIRIIKNGDEGSWELPSDISDEEYYPYDMTVFFDWNFNWKEGNQKYFVDGDYDDETESMQVVVFLNKDFYPELMYDLVADLNDIIAHEYEHHKQYLGLRPDSEVKIKGKQPKNYKYYLQSHEIPAVLQGFRRVMKLRKTGIEPVIDGWLQRNISNQDMSEKDQKKLRSELIKQYELRYGKK